MARITALNVSKGKSNRINVFVDGEFACALGSQIVSREGLQEGQELSPERMETLVQADCYEHALAAAIHFLSYRPRSSAEIRERLQRRGFDSLTQDMVISRLRQQGLLNDEEFAEFWTENRQAFSPRSRRLTRVELLKKGIDRETIERAVNTIDDGSSAYRAAINHATMLLRHDHEDYIRFYRRLGSFLHRRGFDSAVIKQTVEKIWADRESLGGKAHAGLDQPE